MPSIGGFVRDSAGVPANRTLRFYRRDTGTLLGETNSGGGPEIVGDGHWASVSALLSFEGGTTDSSTNNVTVTTAGGAQISSANYKFGGSSLYLNGTGAYAAIAPSNLFVYPGPFTVEMNVFPLSSAKANLYDNFAGSSNSRTLLYLDAGGLIFFYSSSASIATDLGVVLGNQWNHIVIQRDANNLLKIFVNGVTSSQVSYIGTIGIPDYTVILGYTRWKNGDYFNGYIDEVRITKGVARYSADFPPPVTPFPKSSLSLPARAVGEYVFPTNYAGEVQVLCLDDNAEPLENDLVLRTFAV